MAKRKSTRATIRQPALPIPSPDKRRRRELPVFDELALGRGLPIPQVEYLFYAQAGRQWRFDYAWPDYLVAYEREGATWTQGYHTRGKGFDENCEKYNRAAILRWCVIRGTASTERNGQAIDDVQDALRSRGWKEPARAPIPTTT